mgnify:CR=1 FL=1
MTWDQLKAMVDADLAAAGRDGSIKILYLDVSSYPSVGRVDVYCGPDGLEVSGHS